MVCKTRRCSRMVKKLIDRIDKYDDDNLINKNKDEFEEIVQTIPEEIIEYNDGTLKEGIKKKIIVNAYERNIEARKRCIEHYGPICCVCGFDSAKVYGDYFKGKIHVHHIKPLSEIGEEYQVNPIEDLRPICPNCHMIIHSNKEPYSIEQLKRILDIR